MSKDYSTADLATANHPEMFRTLMILRRCRVAAFICIFTCLVILGSSVFSYPWKVLTPHPIVKDGQRQLSPVEKSTPAPLEMNDTTPKPSPHSASRWEKQFHDLFDVPNALSHRLDPRNQTFKDKYVIYRCDNGTMSPCGGWGDRVRGIMTAFIVANLTGRVFKAEIIMPGCNVHRVIEPNRFNWSLPVSFHKHVEVSDRVKILDMWGSDKFYGTFNHIDWFNHPGMVSDFLYMKSNNDNMDKFKESTIHANALGWMRDLNRADMNRLVFSHLFRPSAQLRNKVISFLRDNVQSGEKLICSHLRIGKNPSNPHDYWLMGPQNKQLFHLWGLLNNLASKYKDNAKIFFMSDSAEAIGLAKQQKDIGSKIFTYPGRIVHLDLSHNLNDKETCDGFEKIVFEQLILFHCDALVISNSGIGRLAAYMRNSDNDLYCLVKSGLVSPCKMDEIKHRYMIRN